jgi:hypothetical protein
MQTHDERPSPPFGILAFGAGLGMMLGPRRGDTR